MGTEYNCGKLHLCALENWRWSIEGDLEWRGHACALWSPFLLVYMHGQINAEEGFHLV